ncbi:D-sedoheptulose-7-phosphate isomerase [Nannocystis radixulma]|uniref:D-sedoheptulose-7-phosphate isomerase n=1 Tax=Nannocystis radixulma TaxID=2995305 RepID=UPI0040330829
MVERGFDGLLAVLARARGSLRDDIVRAADLLAATFARGGKVLVCGNGGSATDAQHFAAELVGRFLAPGRAGLPVVALTADSAVLTAWANDVGYDDVFARQVQALGRPGDALVGISTSGRSPNVIAALRAGRDGGLATFALLGGSGGAALDLADCAVLVPSRETQRVQEVHTLALHLICELVEERVLARSDAVPIASRRQRALSQGEPHVPEQRFVPRG